MARPLFTVVRTELVKKRVETAITTSQPPTKSEALSVQSENASRVTYNPDTAIRLQAGITLHEFLGPVTLQSAARPDYSTITKRILLRLCTAVA